ncbi:MAG: SDR family oxidoreductase [Myxococcales bacterium]|nr:SDR family oxidoreductase [Myxococcales bacterium]
MSELGHGAALVVGGSGGIGRAIAEGLAAAGSPVALTYRTRPEAAETLAREIEARGGSAAAFAVDLARGDSVEALVAAVRERFGVIHTVVHAAGSKIDQPYVSETREEDWVATMDADANGFFRVVRASLPALRESRGSIVLLSSAGLARHPQGDVLSVAPKGAAEALVRAVAREEGRFGVRANAVRVGIVEAGMFRELVARGELDERYLDAARRNIALRRFGEVREVVDVVVFLASTKASYVTGQAIAVDGGFSV